MLVVNRYPLRLINVLHFLHHAELQLGDRLLGRLHGGFTGAQILEVALQQLVGVDRTIGELIARMYLLAVAHHHGAAQQNRIFADRIVLFNHRNCDRIVILSLLDLHGARFTAQHRGITGPPGLQQFLNTR